MLVLLDQAFFDFLLLHQVFLSAEGVAEVASVLTKIGDTGAEFASPASVCHANKRGVMVILLAYFAAVSIAAVLVGAKLT